jgi:hypothetical protein
LAAVVAGLVIVFVGWCVRSELRSRRKARYLAQLSARYRLNGRTAEPRRPVTVDELVTRIAAEGLAVRLQWGGNNRRSATDPEWPTGVLPTFSDMAEEGELR